MTADTQLQHIEEAAAAWLVERDGGFGPGREGEFQRWLTSDVRHGATFAALSETWSLIAESAEPAPPSEPAVLGARLVRWAVPLAAALYLALGVGVWRFTRAITEPSGSVPFATVAATEVGMLRTVLLPDGSVVRLNTDSALEVQFDAAVRRVRLTRGEAYFTVTRQPERPFIVSAAGVDVRVVGTVFNVRLRQESVDVLVTEGRVKVDAPAGPEKAAAPVPAPPIPELTAGQRVSIALPPASSAVPVPVPPPAPVAVSPVEIRQTLAWQSRRLDFDATPLDEIVAEINRYNRHKLVVADERLRSQRFGGTFPASDYATLVRMLEVDFGVVAERGAHETRLRLKRPGP